MFLESLVCIKTLEHFYRAGEEVHYFISGSVRCPVASGSKSVYAGPVLVPLVLPEMFRSARVWKPILEHDFDQVYLPGFIEYCSDIVVGRRSGTVRGVRAIAEVGP